MKINIIFFFFNSLNLKNILLFLHINNYIIYLKICYIDENKYYIFLF